MSGRPESEERIRAIYLQFIRSVVVDGHVSSKAVPVVAAILTLAREVRRAAEVLKR